MSQPSKTDHTGSHYTHRACFLSNVVYGKLSDWLNNKVEKEKRSLTCPSVYIALERGQCAPSLLTPSSLFSQSPIHACHRHRLIKEGADFLAQPAMDASTNQDRATGTHTMHIQTFSSNVDLDQQ